MKKAIDRHNRIIQMKWISSIRKLPKHTNLSCASDEVFNLPIQEISPDQKSNLKKVINNENIKGKTRGSI
jgi:hypothetical protein